MYICLRQHYFRPCCIFLHTNSLFRTFRKQIYPGVKNLFLKVTCFFVMPLLFLILYFFKLKFHYIFILILYFNKTPAKSIIIEQILFFESYNTFLNFWQFVCGVVRTKEQILFLKHKENTCSENQPSFLGERGRGVGGGGGGMLFLSQGVGCVMEKSEKSF